MMSIDLHSEIPPTYSDESRVKQNIDDQFAAFELSNRFNALRNQAKDALVFSQASYRRNYNHGRLNKEYEIGDMILINPHSLRLYGSESGVGKKLLKKYDGPFEIMQKLNAVTYRIRLPSTYRIHPVINIAHIEPYHQSPSKFNPRFQLTYNRAEEAEEEWEVEGIVAERRRKKGNRRIMEYRVRYTGFGPEHDLWVPKSYLRNAPDVIRSWSRQRNGSNGPNKV